MNNFKPIRVFTKSKSMKKTLLSILTAFSASAFATGFSIADTDMKWTAGNEWYMAVTGSTSISSFTSTGTGVSWDFTTYQSASTLDTVKCETSSLGGADVLLSSDILAPTDYKFNGSGDLLLMRSQVNSINVTVDNPLSSGFSHSYGSSWNNSSTTLAGFGPTVTLSGEVLAEGTVTTDHGTYNAILVQEIISSSVGTFNYYYWETTEFGRIATLIGANFSVMNQNNFNPVVSTSTNEVNAFGFEVYPNPATEQVTIQSNIQLSNIQVFDAIGNLVLSVNPTNLATDISVAELNAGLYIIRAIENGAVKTTSVVVK